MNRLAVLVPTRSRPQNIKPIVDAWHLTGAFGVADLVFVYDYDDMQRAQYDAVLRRMPELRTLSIPAWKPLVPKLNDAALLYATHYDYSAIAFMGDDHLPRTPMWAHSLIQNHAGNRNWIWYGPDGFQDQRLPTWWSMDTRIIRTLNGMVPAPVQHLYCDNAVKVLGEKAGCLGYDERILVEHMHPLVGKGQMDAQYERVNREQQYSRDGEAFRRWVREQADRDATLIRNVGGERWRSGIPTIRACNSKPC